MTDALAALRTYHTDYEAMGAGWPALDLCAVTRETVPEAAPAAVVAARLAAGGDACWVRYRSALAWSGSAAPEPDTAGPPVRAEWTDGARTGALLRLDPARPGAWLVHRVTERPLGPADTLAAGEVACLRERRALLAHHAAAPIERLVYHVYWTAEPGQPEAVRRTFARFAGFEQQGE